MSVPRLIEILRARYEAASGARYLRIVDALEAAVRAGELQGGDRLPTHRALAEALGVDLTTVTRAYGAARERGLLDGAVGRGTFVRGAAAEADRGLVDLSMNIPPQPEGRSLRRLLAEGLSGVLGRADTATLMAYRPVGGGAAERAAVVQWLEPLLGRIAPERALVAPGAQAVLNALLVSVVRPGGALAVEPLTYPGLLSLARHLGIGLVPVEVDAEGVTPEALERVCAERRPQALYLTPTIQNPTTATMSVERREAVVRIAAAHGLAIIEDDAYGLLPESPLPPIARFAPERTWYVSTLSKCLSPGLRLAFAVAPDAAGAERLAAAMRAVTGMASPLASALILGWIRDGVAQDLLEGVRAEAGARRALAGDILPSATGPANGIHVWLDLPPAWDRFALVDAARARGLAPAPADAFAAAGAARNGVRLSLGAARDRESLSRALQALAATLKSAPAFAHVV
ncbi:PLP-dependent aminotransferase family protein [Caulobacter sp. 17J80-11]|uniref:aminotransferase-like domain-containing protein n=1 Tax=Caulobacter sp. 17J80-11 TaxID=2763502 RepID=UPI00351C1FA3